MKDKKIGFVGLGRMGANIGSVSERINTSTSGAAPASAPSSSARRVSGRRQTKAAAAAPRLACVNGSMAPDCPQTTLLQAEEFFNPFKVGLKITTQVKANTQQ